MSGEERPYWWPVVTDAAWCERLREDYPEDADLSDEGLREKYADGARYWTGWDHLGDAMSDFEPLADAFLEQLAIIDEAVGLLRRATPLECDYGSVMGCLDPANEDPDDVCGPCRLEGEIDDFIAKHGKATQAARCPVCGKNKADNQGQACDDCQGGMQRGGGLDAAYD